MHFYLAEIGLATALLEAVAASVAAGMLIGAFAATVAGLARGWTRREVEARAVLDACVGGLGGVALLLVDLLARCL